MILAADAAEYEGEVPLIFCNDAARICGVRAALGMLPPPLIRLIRQQGVQFAVVAPTCRPSRTIPWLYPFGSEQRAIRTYGCTFDEAGGWYSATTKTIAITRAADVVRATIHEVGHALDYILFDGLGLDVWRFFRPDRAVSAYAESQPAEFWAEAFLEFHCPAGSRDEVWQAGPEMFEVLRSLPELAKR